MFFNQRSCLRYFNANFSPADLTAYVANVYQALTSHVLDDIKICFLKVRLADANLHAYVADARVGDILYGHYKIQIHCRASLGKFILFPIEPEHEINLRGAPYELVPGYFVNSLLVLTIYVIRVGKDEHVHPTVLALW